MNRLLILLAPLAALAFSACQPAAATQHEEAAERCATCHMDEFRSASDPVHVGTNPTTCGVCHSEDAWKPAVWDHPFLLDGAHTKATCFECHKGNPAKFDGTSKQCVGCHRADYNRAPGHVAQKRSTKCEGCHRTTAWGDRHDTHEVPPEPTAPPGVTPVPSSSAPPRPTAKPKPPPQRPPDTTSGASPRR